MEHRTIKIWTDTFTNLKLIHALTGDTMVQILHELVLKKLAEVRDGKTDKSRRGEVQRMDSTT